MKWRHTLDELGAAIGAAADGPEVTFESVSTDTRTIEPGAVFFALSGERFDGNRFVPEAFAKGAAAAVTQTPGTAGPCLVVEDPLAALQAFAAWHRGAYSIPVLAITGSCGKTSTKDLTAAVLSSKYRVVKTRGNLNNEIGCPVSLLELEEDSEVAVIEMGANHVGEIAHLCALARPTESMITMIAPSHLEGFGTVENVGKAKAEVVEALPGDGVFYVNTDDARCVRVAESFPGTKIRFGSGGDVRLDAYEAGASGDATLRVEPVGELRLPLPCRAHATNVLAAVAVGLRHGVEEYEAPLREACARTTRFRIMEVDGIEIIDDTYNANPASMDAALRTLAERPGRTRFAVLGGMLELGDAAAALHYDVGMLAGQLGIDHLFARGDHAEALVAGARSAGILHAQVIEDHADMASAVCAGARPGDIVLVKGSRGMHMERTIEKIDETLNEHEG